MKYLFRFIGLILLITLRPIILLLTYCLVNLFSIAWDGTIHVTLKDCWPELTRVEYYDQEQLVGYYRNPFEWFLEINYKRTDYQYENQ